MCEMLNLFVPGEEPSMGPPIRGLRFEAKGEIQRDFTARFANHKGVFLAGHSGARCLCGFSDWDALYLLAKDLLIRNNIAWLAAVHFWSGDRYTLSERNVDPEDPELCTPVEVGEMIVLRTEPAEQRRHRQVVRLLSRCEGQAVTLVLKNARQVHGTLEAFDATSEVASVAGQVVVAAQVLRVEPQSK